MKIVQKYVSVPKQLLINFKKNQDYQNITLNFLDEHKQIALKPESGTMQALDVLFILNNSDKKYNKKDKFNEHLKYLSEKYSNIILEEYIDATEHRLILVHNKPILLMEKTPTILRGYGKSTIKQLAEQINREVSNKFVQNYGKNFQNCAPSINISKLATYLTNKGLMLEDILKNEEDIELHFAPFILEWNVADMHDSISQNEINNIISFNKKIGLSLSAFDFFIKNDEIIFLEINCEPGISKIYKNEFAIEILKALFNIE